MVAGLGLAIIGLGILVALLQGRQFGILFAWPVIAVAIGALAIDGNAAPGKRLSRRRGTDRADGKTRQDHFPHFSLLNSAIAGNRSGLAVICAQLWTSRSHNVALRERSPQNSRVSSPFGIAAIRHVNSHIAWRCANEFFQSDGRRSQENALLEETHSIAGRIIVFPQDQCLSNIFGTFHTPG
ncbi:hypothetical protein IHQ71_13435 [Rhizobium sp. TH2]|nr:hypothetical protein [Rhizobium sp. TH2]UVC12151.1 hypothetical protein IHQ71_13435 [Rhizobium sp. TH2]